MQLGMVTTHYPALSLRRVNLVVNSINRDTIWRPIVLSLTYHCSYCYEGTLAGCKSELQTEQSVKCAVLRTARVACGVVTCWAACRLLAGLLKLAACPGQADYSYGCHIPFVATREKLLSGKELFTMSESFPCRNKRDQYTFFPRNITTMRLRNNVPIRILHYSLN